MNAEEALFKILEEFKKKSYEELCGLTEEEKYFEISHEGKKHSIEVELNRDTPGTVKVFLSVLSDSPVFFKPDIAAYFGKTKKGELLENDDVIF